MNAALILDKRITRLISLTLAELDVIRGKLLARSVRDESTGCLNWQGAKTSRGYGSVVARKGWVESTHVLSMFVFNGIAVPSSMTINHRCENKQCVEPRHLQQASVRENNLYSHSLIATNAAKSHCADGHPFTGSNLRVSSRGKRICVTCHRQMRRESEKRRADRENPNRQRRNRKPLALPMEVAP